MKIPGLRSSSILINWSLTYISILLIPVIISMAVYITSESILKKEITRTNNQLLRQVKNAIDSRLKDIGKTGLQLSFNQNIKSLPLQKNNADRILDYNSVIRDLRIYKLSNSFVDNFFIYIGENKCAISGSSYLSEDYFINNTGGYRGLDKNQWKQAVLQNDREEFIPLLPEGENGFCNAVAYTKPIYPGSSGLTKVLLITIVENSKLYENINNIDLENESSTFIIDKSDVIISYGMHRNLQGLIKYKDLPEESGILQTAKGNEKLTVAYITSDITGWKYVSIIPTKVFSQKIDFIRKLTYICIALSLLIGFIVILLSVRFNYNPLERLVKELSASSGIISDKKINEYKFIQKAIEQTIDEKKKVLKSMQSQSSIVKTNLLVKLLKGYLDFNDSLLDTLRKNDIRFETQDSLVVLFYIEQSSDFFKEDCNMEMSLKEKQELACFIISNIVEELACQENYGVTTQIDEMVACIINFKNLQEEKTSMQETVNIVKYVIEILRDRFKINTKVSISDIKRSILKFSEAYEEAKGMVEYKKILGIDELGAKSNTEIRHGDGLKSLYYFPLQMEQKLINYVKAGDFENSQQVINEIYEKNLMEASPSVVIIKCLMFDLISTMFKTLSEIDGFCDNSFLEELDPINRLINCHTVFDMKSQIISILHTVCQYITSNRKNDHRHIKNQVMGFVAENYADIDLNISMIADKLEITPAYLSRIFREQSSIGLMDYINQVRLDRARELLKNSKSSINDIANEAGFQNTNTFIRIFKKYEGVTPGKFRETTISKK